MARPWDTKDLIDFEYYLYQDEEGVADKLAARDRRFFLGLKEVPTERADLFHDWLHFRLNLENPAERTGPGEAFGECFGILQRAFPLLGLISGAGLATSLLQYHGTQAVNVSNYFGVLIVVQIVMLIALLAATIFRKKLTGRGFQTTYPLISRLAYKLATRMSAGALGKLGGEKRSAIAGGLGELKIKKAIYGRVIYQPVFRWVQSFGILFNIGALIATLLRVFTRDIAFGWQSTVQVASGSVHGLVSLLAAPWRWIFGEGKGYPTLEQVEGSRMVLKEGMLDMATGDLVSWWPFLCLCLVVYGLIPRLVLWGYATFAHRRNLSELNFSHASCERLYRRMTTPLLESSAAKPNGGRSKVRTGGDESVPEEYVPPFSSAKRGASTLLLVPEELAGELDSDLLIRMVEKSVGRTVSRTRPYNLSRSGMGDLGIQPKESVTIYQEAWQPPIREYLSFVKRLREHVAPETAVVVLLNGRTKPDEAFAPVKGHGSPDLDPGDENIGRPLSGNCRGAYFMSEMLRFAVVGHPNEGKSSVVSTLAEDDTVPVSAIPGETVVCKSYPVKIDGVEIVDFIDTPGFQNPVYMRDWLIEHGGDGDPLIRAFVDVHESKEEFSHDVELLRPILDGAGIIYIVDGSRPVRAPDQAEMEILRKTGRTRMAIINCKDEEIDYRQEWQLAFSQNFNAYRVFNAHRATYRERIDLLESLKGVNPDWQPIMAKVIEAFKDDWSGRRVNAADAIAELLEKNVSYRKEQALGDEDDVGAIQEKVITAYRSTLSRNEDKAHEKLRKIFKHNVFKSELDDEGLLHDDLFSERTWHLLGLDKKQLVTASALVGAASGLGVDALTLGSSFGLFAAGGAAIGAASAYFGGEGLAGNLSKTGGFFGKFLGGKQVKVGPAKSPQIYFILLDRALIYYEAILHWSHGRRSEGAEVMDDAVEKVGAVAQFSEEQRRICSAHFRAAVKGNRGDLEIARTAFTEMLVEMLREVSEK